MVYVDFMIVLIYGQFLFAMTTPRTRALLLLLLAALCGVNCRLTSLSIDRDNRRFFHIESFGFEAGGKFKLVMKDLLVLRVGVKVCDTLGLTSFCASCTRAFSYGLSLAKHSNLLTSLTWHLF